MESKTQQVQKTPKHAGVHTNEPGFIAGAILDSEERTVNFLSANKPYNVKLRTQAGGRCLIAQMKTSGTPAHTASLQQLITNRALTCLEYFV